MQRILLTGGAGFIGTTLARRLVDDHELVLLDNLHRNALAGTGLLNHRNVTFVRGDVLDLELVTEAALGCDAIVHLAAIAGPQTVHANPVKTMLVNFMGTANVLEAARATSITLSRLIEFSSSEICGRNANGATERDVTIEQDDDPRWAYAVSKLAGEHLAHAYHGQYGLPTVSIRLFNVYGPGQVGEGAVHTFIERALAGQPLIVHNDGRQVRTWCYVDDVVDALVLALERDEAVGEVINIGDPRSVVTVNELAVKVLALAPDLAPYVDRVAIAYEPLGFADVDIRIPNIDKAYELLGWEPRVDLDEGLRRTFAWYAACDDKKRAAAPVRGDRPIGLA